MSGQLYPAGEGATVGAMKPGDFILTHRNNLYAHFIRFGQRRRYRGADRGYTVFNHAALIVSKDGDLVEALGKGVEKTHISKYQERDYVHVVPVVHVAGTGMGADAPLESVQVAERAMRFNAIDFGQDSVGDRYAWVTIACIGFGLLTGGNLTFGFDGSQICSGLVARALERLGYVFGRNPSEMMPADLASEFGVHIS